MISDLLRALEQFLASPVAGPDPDEPLAAVQRRWQAVLDDAARPLRAAIAEAVTEVRGRDWPEQAWDSYQYHGWIRQHWAVQAPLTCLTCASTPLVPVIAAGGILGPPFGKGYRKYWGRSKGFLAIVAEIAQRFPGDGDHLAGELRARYRSLPASEREAVQLHLAALGLLDEDPSALARQLLYKAAEDDLGGRGELLLHALEGIRELPPEQRRGLLAQAAVVAQRTTAFVASNPFAAVVEAMSAEALGGVWELSELLDRASELKIRDWLGWDRALHACGRALTGLVRRHGEAAAKQALERLAPYAYDFPSLPAELRLAAARALAPPLDRAWASEALETARRLRPTRGALRAEVAAAAWLAEHDGQRGLEQLRATSAKLLRRRWGRGRESALQEAVIALAELDSGDGARLAEAIELQAGLRTPEGRWCSAVGVACAPNTAAAGAVQQLEYAARAMRWHLFHRSPLDLLGPLVTELGQSLPGGLRHPVGRRWATVALAAAAGRLSGPELAAELMPIGSRATQPEALATLAALAAQPDYGWWRLPLLAMLSDGLTARLNHELHLRSSGVVPHEDPDGATENRGR